jgi:hypothetical protein
MHAYGSQGGEHTRSAAGPHGTLAAHPITHPHGCQRRHPDASREVVAGLTF